MLTIESIKVADYRCLQGLQSTMQDQVMEFRFSKEYLNKMIKDPLWGAVVFDVLGIVFAVGIYFTDLARDLSVSVLIIWIGVLLALTWKNIRLSNHWKTVGKEISFEVHPACFIEKYQAMENKTLASAVKVVYLQNRYAEVRSIIIKYSNGAIHKLEGFDRMKMLATQIRRVVGSDKMKERRFLHFW